MKGFIEVSANGGRQYIIAVSAIVGIADQGPGKGCIISLSTPLFGLTGNGQSATLEQRFIEIQQALAEQGAD